MQIGIPIVDEGRRNGKVRPFLLSDIDKRTAAARRARELIDAIQTDLGGVDRLAIAEQQLIQRAVIIATIAEDLEAKWLSGEPIDTAMLCTLGNAQRRLLEAVGLRQIPRNVTPELRDYLAGAHPEGLDEAAE